MPTYTCECCEYLTENLANYKKHLKTMKHKKSTQSQPLVNLESTFSQPLVNLFATQSQHKKCLEPSVDFEKKLQKSCVHCKYCKKPFSFKQSMYKHIKYSCRKNKDEDTRELVRLLNLQLEEKNKLLQTKDKLLKDETKRIEDVEQQMCLLEKINDEKHTKMQKQINKLSNKLQINNIQTNINVNLHSYKDTDISHLTDNDYIQAIHRINQCVPDLMKKIHYNPSKPENMNIYVPNLKNKHLMIYEDGIWNLETHDNKMGTIFNDKYLLLCGWIDKCKDNILIKKFNRFENNIEDISNLDDIKQDLIRLMYNHRVQAKKNKPIST